MLAIKSLTINVGSGSGIDALKYAIDNVISSWVGSYILTLVADSRWIALGQKHNDNYCSFILIGYNRLYVLSKENGTWYVYEVNKTIS